MGIAVVTSYTNVQSSYRSKGHSHVRVRKLFVTEGCIG